ncbi:protein-glutamate O-methyltransferase CheR [soil metagenome]
MYGPKISDKEVELLLHELFQKHGYDFTDYSRASFKRRISRLIIIDRFPSFAELLYKVKTDEKYLKRFVEEITVNVTEMFRDPSFFEALRKKILPLLNTYPLIRIWHAGCSTGEEVYSLAIMLLEENLYHKSLLYATDLNPTVLEKASSGIFPLNQMKLYSENYIFSGGKNEFSNYYSANYAHAKFDEKLKEKMIFATHNLVSDRSFNEFQLIICRNVLIYFDVPLQQKVFHLFDDSLEKLGFLALGSKETLRYSGIDNHFQQVGKEKIWRKV